MQIRRIASFAAVMAAAVLALPALAQGPPDYGFEWRTVGAPGNPNARPRDYYLLRLDEIGRVGRVTRPYRLSLTEITLADQLEYVQAYSSYHPEGIYDRSFGGYDIYNERNDPNDPGWYIQPGTERWPAKLGWLHAARFCNWLHNGKNPEQWAFESGAYDMSTFSQLPNGEWVGQDRRSPGAQFWIPSLSEWIKGMHFDPDRYGPGEGGYWMYPTTNNEVPIGGFPGTPGAETSAGRYEGYDGQTFDVGSYPNTMSPWGLLDGSGGAGEWVEDDPAGNGFRRADGSGTGAWDLEYYDRLDWTGFGPSTHPIGLRLASAVPSPSVLAPFAFLLALIPAQRRPRP